MPSLLKRHPDSRSTEIARITVNAMRAGKPGALLVGFAVDGLIGALAVPPKVGSSRADGLWRHTCFEIFLRGPGDETYCEFNFSPSTQWAAYRFSGYRKGVAPIIGIPDPAIDVLVGEKLELMAVLDLTGLPELPGNAPWRAGISAIVEEIDGNKTYWALAHPQGNPDFHHADGFVFDLPVPEQT